VFREKFIDLDDQPARRDSRVDSRRFRFADHARRHAAVDAIFRIATGQGAVLHGFAQLAQRRFGRRALLKGIVELGKRGVPSRNIAFRQTVAPHPARYELGYPLTESIRGRLPVCRPGMSYACQRGYETVGQVVEHLVQAFLDVEQQVGTGPLEQRLSSSSEPWS
jgi:hypothetical protein